MLDVLFHSTKHVGLEHPVQSLDLLLRRQVSEVPLEIIEAEELFGVNVIQQAPKLSCVVLDRGSGQEQHSFTGQSFQRRQYLCVFVFESMGLIDYDELERDINYHIIEVKCKDFVAGD